MSENVTAPLTAQENPEGEQVPVTGSVGDGGRQGKSPHPASPEGPSPEVTALLNRARQYVEREKRLAYKERLEECALISDLVSALAANPPAEPQSPLAWICTHEYGRVRHFSLEDGWHLEIVQTGSAINPPADVRVADAWLIVRSDGTKEVVLSPLTDDTYMDEGDEAWPLYRANPEAQEHCAVTDPRAKNTADTYREPASSGPAERKPDVTPICTLCYRPCKPNDSGRSDCCDEEIV